MKYYLFEVVKFEKRKEVLVPYYERFNPDNLFHWNDKLFKKFVSMKHDSQSKSSNESLRIKYRILPFNPITILQTKSLLSSNENYRRKNKKEQIVTVSVPY